MIELSIYIKSSNQESNTKGLPKRYLDTDTKILQMKSGIECWTMSLDLYAREAISNIENLLEQDWRK